MLHGRFPPLMAFLCGVCIGLVLAVAFQPQPADIVTGLSQMEARLTSRIELLQKRGCPQSGVQIEGPGGHSPRVLADSGR